MAPTRLLFEGTDIHEVLERVRSEYGTGARIVAADKVRTGGIGGFFARERFEVAIEVETDVEAPAEPAPVAPAVTAADVPARPAAERLPAAQPELQPVAAFVPQLLGVAAGPGRLDETPRHHPPVLEEPAQLPESFLLGLIESVDAREGELNSVGSDHAPATLGDSPTFQAVLAALTADDLAPVAPVEEVRVEQRPAAFALPAVDVEASTVEAREIAAMAAAPEVPVPAPPAVPVLAAPEPDADPRRAALLAVGLPEHLVPASDDAVGTYEALVEALDEVARPPRLPGTAGEVVAVIGRDAELAAAATLLAEQLGLGASTESGEHVELVSRTALPGSWGAHMTGPAAARRRATRLARRPTPTVVAVDPGAGRGAAWTRQVLEALDVSAVVVVVDAGVKPGDLRALLDSYGQVEAVAVVGADRTLDPATVLGLGVPVLSVDGRASSPHTWAALLAERLSR